MASLEAAAAPSSADGPPPTKLLIRSRDGIQLMHGPRGDKGLDDAAAMATVGADSSVAPQGNFCEFSPDGSRLARTGGSVAGVEIVPTDNAEGGAAAAAAVTISGVASRRVQKLAWSPQGTYLVTWQKFDTAANFPNVPAALLNAVPGTFDEPGSSEAAAAEGEPRKPKIGNLRVWEASTGALVDAFSMKKMSSMTWPALQWTADESWCLRMVTNEVLVYRGGGGTNRGQPGIEGGFLDKIRLPNVASFSVSPSPALPVKVAMFVPESGKPANVQIFAFPGAKDRPPVAAKSFFNAQEIAMDWSPNGEAVLVKTHTDVDGKR